MSEILSNIAARLTSGPLLKIGKTPWFFEAKLLHRTEPLYHLERLTTWVEKWQTAWISLSIDPFRDPTLSILTEIGVLESEREEPESAQRQTDRSGLTYSREKIKRTGTQHTREFRERQKDELQLGSRKNYRTSSRSPSEGKSHFQKAGINPAVGRMKKLPTRLPDGWLEKMTRNKQISSRLPQPDSPQKSRTGKFDIIYRGSRKSNHYSLGENPPLPEKNKVRDILTQKLEKALRRRLPKTSTSVTVASENFSGNSFPQSQQKRLADSFFSPIAGEQVSRELLTRILFPRFSDRDEHSFSGDSPIRHSIFQTISIPSGKQERAAFFPKTPDNQAKPRQTSSPSTSREAKAGITRPAGENAPTDSRNVPGVPPLPRNPEPLAPPQVEEKISGLFPSKKAHREVHSRPSSAADPAMLPPRTSGDINEEEELIDLADKIRRILEDEAKRFGINI